MLVNTSSNGPGEPIVRTPAQALQCAIVSGMDAVVLEDCLVKTSNGVRTVTYVRHFGRIAADLVLLSWRNGRWWMLVVVPPLLFAATLALAAKVAVPTAIYTLFDVDPPWDVEDGEQRVRNPAALAIVGVSAALIASLVTGRWTVAIAVVVLTLVLFLGWTWPAIPGRSGTCARPAGHRRVA